jgi:AcrR family transcriptional regulator
MAKGSPLRKAIRVKIEDMILCAVEELALEVGLGGITIAAVADRAGVAVGTLYNYFSNSDEMVAELFRVRRAQLIPEIQDAARQAKPLVFEARLRAFVHKLLDAYERSSRFLHVAVLVDRAGAKVKPRDTALMDATLVALDDILRDGARKKRFPIGRVAAYAHLMHGMLRSMFVWRLDEGQSIASDADFIVDTFLHGIG